MSRLDSNTIRALQGQPGVAAGAVERGLELALEPPDAAAWREFLDRSLAGLGTLLLLAGTFFFFAYNWRELSGAAKLVLIESVLLGLFLATRRLGLDTLAGRVTLSAASALIGALLAVYGQVYQTGADAYGLFALWALLALPWVLAAGFPPLWLGWLLLVNLALWLFCSETQLLGDSPFEDPLFAVLMAGLNALAWWLGERLRPRHAWLQAAWLLPVACLLCLFYLTWSVCYGIASQEWAWLSALVLAAVLAWMVGYYRSRRRDLFFLAAASASAITVCTTAITRLLWSAADSAAFWMLLACVLLAQLALAGSWLRYEMRRP